MIEKSEMRNHSQKDQGQALFSPEESGEALRAQLLKKNSSVYKQAWLRTVIKETNSCAGNRCSSHMFEEAPIHDLLLSLKMWHLLICLA